MLGVQHFSAIESSESMGPLQQDSTEWNDSSTAYTKPRGLVSWELVAEIYRWRMKSAQLSSCMVFRSKPSKKGKNQQT